MYEGESPFEESGYSCYAAVFVWNISLITKRENSQNRMMGSKLNIRHRLLRHPTLSSRARREQKRFLFFSPHTPFVYEHCVLTGVENSYYNSPP